MEDCIGKDWLKKHDLFDFTPTAEQNLRIFNSGMEMGFQKGIHYALANIEIGSNEDGPTLTVKVPKNKTILEIIEELPKGGWSN